MAVVWDKLATCSSALLAHGVLGALCFWRFGVRAPLLDGSTVLTNICTDMEFYSDRRSRCRVRAPLKSEENQTQRVLSTESPLRCQTADTGNMNTTEKNPWNSGVTFREFVLYNFQNMNCTTAVHLSRYVVMLSCVSVCVCVPYFFIVIGTWSNTPNSSFFQ